MYRWFFGQWSVELVRASQMQAGYGCLRSASTCSETKHHRFKKKYSWTEALSGSLGNGTDVMLLNFIQYTYLRESQRSARETFHRDFDYCLFNNHDHKERGNANGRRTWPVIDGTHFE